MKPVRLSATLSIGVWALLAASPGCASDETDETSTDCAPDEAACQSNQDCCGFESGASFCMDRPGGPRCAAVCEKNSDCATGCCAPASGRGPAVCATTHCMGDVLDLCAYHVQCSSRMCAGYCTKECTSNADCTEREDGTSAAPGSSFCLETVEGTHTCFPSCNDDADCARFPSNLKCQTAPDVSNIERKICTP